MIRFGGKEEERFQWRDIEGRKISEEIFLVVQVKVDQDLEIRNKKLLKCVSFICVYSGQGF